MFNLSNYLWKNRMKSKDFAAKCGISQPTARKLGRSPVSLRIAKKVAAVVGCSVGSLINPKQHK